MGQSSISYLWREPEAAKGFATGVSLHSHTNQSKETLDFISELSKDWSVLQPVMRWAERRCKRLTGINPDYARSYWTPPLTPSLAFDLERRQIEEKLELQGLVSITDHDDIQAPMLLRTVAGSRHIPVSVEWTVPVGPTPPLVVPTMAISVTLPHDMAAMVKAKSPAASFLSLESRASASLRACANSMSKCLRRSGSGLPSMPRRNFLSSRKKSLVKTLWR